MRKYLSILMALVLLLGTVLPATVFSEGEVVVTEIEEPAPQEEKPLEEEKPTEKPAEQKPAEQKPAEDKLAEEKPAAAEKPAEVKRQRSSKRSAQPFSSKISSVSSKRSKGLW